jgi:DNA invertase Pin-like site-specific DNA recombinase
MGEGLVSNIPEAREHLQWVLDRCKIGPHARGRIIAALDLMRREPPVGRNKPDKNRPVNELMAGDIRHLYASGMSQADIAAYHEINIGRVSEVLNGKRP